MVSKDHIAHFRSKLQEEKRVLEEELSSLGVRNPSNPDDWVASKPAGDVFGADQNDNADIIDNEQQNNASLNELEGRLNQVIRALDKIDAGTFGTCEVGQEEIEHDRLEANPAARTCKVHMSEEAGLA